MQNQRGLFRRGSIIVLTAVLAGVVVGASLAQEASPEQPPSLQAVAGSDHETALAALDQAQRRLDEARARSVRSGSSSASSGQLDAAQQMLDQARARLLSGEPAPQQDLVSLSDDGLRQQLAYAQDQLDAARQMLAGKPGMESSLETLDLAQQRLDATRAWLEGSADMPSFAAPGPEQMQALYDRARRMLDDTRSQLMSSPSPDPGLLRQLEEAERNLGKARRESAALGLME